MKIGRIKRGEGGLIGNAGEHYVMAELLKRGVVASLAPRNAPAFDILATKKGHTARIRVKTKSEDIDEWQWSVKKNGRIFRDLSRRGDWSVLVHLATDTKDMRFYVLPTMRINAWLVKIFRTWISTPGRKGRKRSSENPKRTLSYKKYSRMLQKHLNDWGALWR